MPSRQWGGQAVEVGGRRGGRAGAKRARRRQSPTGLGPPPPCSLLLLSRPPPRARAGASPRAIAATPPRPGPRASPGRRRWGECGSPRHRPAFRSARDPHSQIAPLSVRRRQAARRESAPSPLATRTRTSLSLSLSVAMRAGDGHVSGDKHAGSITKEDGTRGGGAGVSRKSESQSKWGAGVSPNGQAHSLFFAGNTRHRAPWRAAAAPEPTPCWP